MSIIVITAWLLFKSNQSTTDKGGRRDALSFSRRGRISLSTMSVGVSSTRISAVVLPLPRILASIGRGDIHGVTSNNIEVQSDWRGRILILAYFGGTDWHFFDTHNEKVQRRTFDIHHESRVIEVSAGDILTFEDKELQSEMIRFFKHQGHSPADEWIGLSVCLVDLELE